MNGNRTRYINNRRDPDSTKIDTLEGEVDELESEIDLKYDKTGGEVSGDITLKNDDGTGGKTSIKFDRTDHSGFNSIFDIHASYAVSETQEGLVITSDTSGGTIAWFDERKRVGINNTTPSEALDVTGNVNISSGSEYKINGTALAKGDVGLGNVDNTADADKPISSATVTALALKATLASPALTGNPTAPTQSASDNSTKIATTAYVDTATGSSPSTEIETRTVRIIAGSASTDYAIANTDWLVIIKHTASGITATLPSDASDKQIIYIKNSCGASNNTLDVMAFSGGGVTHTIDYTFSGVRLNGTSTSSASVDTQVNQCFKAMYLTTNTTWVRINDGY